MKKFAAFMYHQIGEDPDKYNIPLGNFLQQIDLIRSLGFKILSLEDASRSAADDFCVFTFDDGFKSDLYVAELLAEYGFTATFFLIKQFLTKDETRFLNKAEVKKISDLGHRIGIHGNTHKWWTLMKPDHLIGELKNAKYFFEDLTGKEVISCSAPGGKLNNMVIKAITDSNLFKYIRNSEPDLVRVPLPVVVPSFSVDESFKLEMFRKILKMDRNQLFLLKMKYQIKNIGKIIFNK